ncbi:MAG TPA: prolipoprotein diacylglyceryl transferase [Polyangiaceae bacterium]|nr:prolipoprotein diacylglyceryl transferase [Polyangiaceae bacterium]
MLPTVTWNVDPVFLRLPREGVAIALGAFGALSLVYGLAKKAKDQVFSALFFALLAVVVGKYMPENYGIRYYSLIFVGVFLGGHALLRWQIRRAGGPSEDANDFILYGVLGVLLGARLGHVLFYDLDKAIENPAWVLQIWTGGLASHGAVLGLIIAMFLFTKRRGISFLEGSDRFAYSAALGATLVRLGNLLNSEIVGKQTDGTWGFRFPRFEADPPLRHPSQIYEVALGLTVLGALYLFDKKLGEEKRPRGAMISGFFLLYFVGRFVVEFFKEFQPGESTETGIRMGQILSLPGILLGVYGLYWAFSRKIPAQWPHAAPPPELDQDEDEDDDDEDDEEDSSDEDDDAADEEDEEQPSARSAPKKPADANPRASKKGSRPATENEDLDDDVADEFDAEGRLKRVRE